MQKEIFSQGDVDKYELISNIFSVDDFKLYDAKSFNLDDLPNSIANWNFKTANYRKR